MSQESMFDLAGKTALVTGASSGLGVTFAEVLSEWGASVVLTARREDRLREVETRVKNNGGRVASIRCDVADAGQVKSLMDEAWADFGRVDIVVNNAGISGGGPVPEKVPDELFEQTVQINLNGAWYCCREAGARMLSDGKGGSIINIASIAGMGGQQNFPPAYQATKAALINLTRNLACSWADRNVRVNAIAPGWFPSEMTNDLFTAPPFLDRVQKQAPMGRIGEPRELAGALVLLASDASSFITGQTFVVDGGLSASVGTMPISDEVAAIFAEGVPDGLGQPIVPASND